MMEYGTVQEVEFEYVVIKFDNEYFEPMPCVENKLQLVIEPWTIWKRLVNQIGE